MAIRYDIVLDNNLVYKIQYICFGSLNSLHDITEPRGLRQSETLSASNLSMREMVQQFEVSKIQYIRYHFGWMNSPLSAAQLEIYKREIKLIISELPCIKDIIFLDMGEQYAYVRVKNQPADKVMFALTVLRNLTAEVFQFDNGVPKGGYFLLRHHNVSVLNSLVFSSILPCNNTTDWSRSTEYVLVTDYMNYNGESSYFNAHTFGMESYRRFMAQDNYAPWVQGSFAENGNGYRRNSHFINDRVVFEGADLAAPSILLNQDHTEEMPSFRVRLEGLIPLPYNSANSPWRTMTDAHSIPGDSFPVIPGMFRDAAVGFYVGQGHMPFGEHENTGARFVALLDYINTL